jgi:hypothetical protein
MVARKRLRVIKGKKSWIEIPDSEWFKSERKGKIFVGIPAELLKK